MSLFALGWLDQTDVQMYNAHSLYRLKGRLPDPHLASKWIQFLDPLPVLPCSVCRNEGNSIFALAAILSSNLSRDVAYMNLAICQLQEWPNQGKCSCYLNSGRGASRHLNPFTDCVHNFIMPWKTKKYNWPNTDQKRREMNLINPWLSSRSYMWVLQWKVSRPPWLKMYEVHFELF